MENEVKLKALYSYCDLNAHINNSAYLDIALNLVPIDVLKNNSLKKIDIEYNREIRLDEEFIIDYGNVDKHYYFSNPSFKLEIVF